MNFLEHFKVTDEEFKGKYFGEVIDRNDPEDLHRIKVRVFGVFDSPINIDHIPWAYPVNIYAKLPTLKEKVMVEFIDGDLYRPIYYS